MPRLDYVKSRNDEVGTFSINSAESVSAVIASESFYTVIARHSRSNPQKRKSNIKRRIERRFCIICKNYIVLDYRLPQHFFKMLRNDDSGTTLQTIIMDCHDLTLSSLAMTRLTESHLFFSFRNDDSILIVIARHSRSNPQKRKSNIKRRIERRFCIICKNYIVLDYGLPRLDYVKSRNDEVGTFSINSAESVSAVIASESFYTVIARKSARIDEAIHTYINL